MKQNKKIQKTVFFIFYTFYKKGGLINFFSIYNQQIISLEPIKSSSETFTDYEYRIILYMLNKRTFFAAKLFLLSSTVMASESGEQPALQDLAVEMGSDYQMVSGYKHSNDVDYRTAALKMLPDMLDETIKLNFITKKSSLVKSLEKCIFMTKTVYFGETFITEKQANSLAKNWATKLMSNDNVTSTFKLSGAGIFNEKNPLGGMLNSDCIFGMTDTKSNVVLLRAVSSD